MNQEILTPPEYKELSGPSIFLAGPIQGTSDWQAEAIKIISLLNDKVAIFNPHRDYLDNEFVYEKQVDWETHYLRMAGNNGVILFWLAKEHTHDPERAYAQTSRFELAEWKMRHERDGAKLVVGIEDGFSGARYIKRRLSQDCPNIKICSSLQETCEKAVALLNS